MPFTCQNRAATCPPETIAIGQTASCTATVTDTAAAGATTPTILFTSSGRGVFSATQCTLSGSGTSVSCTVYYAAAPGVPTRGQTISAYCSGDNLYQSSWSSTTLT